MRNETLYDLFMGAYDEATNSPWRVYGNKSHKLLTDDYGKMTSNELDNLVVSSCRKMNGYWRINVFA